MKNLKLSLFAFLLALPMWASAASTTPVETFIRQMKESTKFVPVSNIWTIDQGFDKQEMLKQCDNAEALVIDYTAVANLMREKNSAISLEIPGVNGGSVTLELARYDFLSNDFQVHTLGENNKDELFSYTPGLYYRGIVKGSPGSMATASFFNNEVYVVFTRQGEPGNFAVVPNTMIGNYYDYNQHYILYNDADVKNRKFAPSCDNDKLPAVFNEPLGKTTTYYNNNVYNSCTEVRVYEVGDYALYLTKSSSATNVTNFLTALFNHQATIYRNEGIPIVLKYLQVNTATDNYQHITVASSSRFLDTFGKVTQNTMHGCDVAILMSTALNGGYGALGGVAWLRAMCQAYQPSSFFGPYGFCNMDNSNVSSVFPVYTWDIEVAAHEMGHIVGSPHTHACVWNPPARNTAIDGCYTIEGSCATPSNPTSAVGGTIMSYCHLTSSGIKFVNGFGPQPGDTIRRYINTRFAAGCGAVYVDSVTFAKKNKVLKANRECTDATGMTYYWADNNTADHTDDSLVLMIKKNGNNIGNLDTVGFSISDTLMTGFSTNLADTLYLPAGITGMLPKKMAMHRYWRMRTPYPPTTAVEVIFPFNAQDSTDVDGSVPGAALVKNYIFYKLDDTTVNSNPTLNFTGATASDFAIYTNATTASTTNWSLSYMGNTKLAHLMTTKLNTSGGGFYQYGSAATSDLLGNSGIQVYPNPTHDQWYIAVERNNNEPLTLQLYTADGRMIHTQALTDGTINTVTATAMPTGMYFFRIISGSEVFTGNLMKN